MYEQRASRKVYDAMCEFFGTSKDVALRRDVMDINEILTGHAYAFDKNKKYRYFQNFSGSTGDFLNQNITSVIIIYFVSIHLKVHQDMVYWRFSQNMMTMRNI